MGKAAASRTGWRAELVGAATASPGRLPRVTTTDTTTNAVLRLQRLAGNRAVTGLVGHSSAARTRLQRVKSGWHDADTAGPGWNVTDQVVQGTQVRRVPVEGITSGNQQDFYRETWTDKKGDTHVEDERLKTKESAAGKAIVLMSEALDVTAPVQVMLHLHGYAYRSGDPHAGWRQDKGDQSVRDVDQDRIEQQIQASGATQLVAVLAQGVGKSDFGKLPHNDYVREVLGLVAKMGLPRFPKAPEHFELVLSAHSGGGFRVINALQVGKKHRLTEPGNLSEVILFDAINNDDQAKIVAGWAEEHMLRVRSAAPADRPAELAKCPRLRAYHSDSGTYVHTYGTLRKLLQASYDRNPDDLKGPLAERFPLPPHLAGAGHETVIRGFGDDPTAGPLADALRPLAAKPGKGTLATSGETTWHRHDHSMPAGKGGPTPTPAGTQTGGSPAQTGSGAAHTKSVVVPTAGSSGAAAARPSRKKGRSARHAPTPMDSRMITADRLGDLNTPEETAFRKAVYAEQFRQVIEEGKPFFPGLPAGQVTGRVDGKPIRKDVEGDARALLDEAKAALQAEQAKGDLLAQGCTAIGVNNAYRSLEHDFTAWQNAYPNALDRTAKRRAKLADGPYSTEAVSIVVADLHGSKAVPGFSNHTLGLAIDFETTQNGKRLGPSRAQAKLWQQSWLYGWLHQHAGGKQFTQLSTEEWHWDHAGGAPVTSSGDDAAGVGAGAGDAGAAGPQPRRGTARTGARPSPTGTPTTADPGRPVVPTTEEATITFGRHARPEVLAPVSLDVLRSVLAASGLRHATITSTARKAEDQARAMYQNLVGSGKGQGVKAQRRLYGPAGRQVVETFVALRAQGLGAAEIQAGMAAKILEIGPAKVSRHCADPAKLNVFDVGPASLGDDDAQEAFVAAAHAEVGRRVSTFIPYPKDPGDHFEIKP